MKLLVKMTPQEAFGIVMGGWAPEWLIKTARAALSIPMVPDAVTVRYWSKTSKSRGHEIKVPMRFIMDDEWEKDFIPADHEWRIVGYPIFSAPGANGASK